MIHITSSYFCAGAIIGHKGTIVKAAPIIAYMIGWRIKDVYTYCNKRGWKFTRRP